MRRRKVPDKYTPTTYSYAEAIEYICAVEKCDRADADKQLRDALTQGFGPLYWVDPTIPNLDDGRVPVLGDDGRIAREQWQTIAVDDASDLHIHANAIERRWQNREVVLSAPISLRFCSPVWEMGDVFGWILYRDASRFGDISTEEEWRAASYIAMLDARISQRMRDVPQQLAGKTELLHALQAGDLVAKRWDANPVDRDFWFSRTEADLPPLCRMFRFRREEVLKIWPQALIAEPIEEKVALPIAIPTLSVDRVSSRGPTPGTVNRYLASDRALFPDIELLMCPADPTSIRLSLTAACEQLALDARIAGNGTCESRARRLRDAYKRSK